MIENANLESLEVMRCQVEEKARAEAMLIAKLEEEAAAAKLAIDRAKTEKEGLLSKIASGLSSRSPRIVGKSADIRKMEEGRWETLRKQGRASVSRRMLQGWVMIEAYCQGVECGKMPLLSFRNSSPFCVVCGGSGSGKDGEYNPSKANSCSPVRSPRRVKRSSTTTSEIPKLFEVVQVQPSEQRRLPLPLDVPDPALDLKQVSTVAPKGLRVEANALVDVKNAAEVSIKSPTVSVEA